MKFIAGLILALVLFSSCFTNYALAKSANDGKYEILGNRLKGTPTFCAFEPEKDPILPESTVPLLMKEVKTSIDLWTISLSSHKQGKWNTNFIVIPRDKQVNYDKSSCDVIVLFKKKDPNEIDPLSAMKQESPPFSFNYELPDYRYYKEKNTFLIEIFYQAKGTCLEREPVNSAEYIEFTYDCRQESTATLSIIGAILRHSIGHAFGLGHYVSKDNSFYSNSSIMEKLPKMVGYYAKINPDDVTVKPRDLEKLKEIYNYEGWGAQPIVIKETPKKLDGNKKKIINENKLDKKRTDELKTKAKKDTTKTEKKIIKPKITKPQLS